MKLSNLNIHPKVLFAGIGAAVGSVAVAVLHQCGGAGPVADAAVGALPPVVGVIFGYLKSSGTWAPTPPASPAKP